MQVYYNIPEPPNRRRCFFCLPIKSAPLMKFRRLYRDELEALREDFVIFLAKNGYDAAGWTKLTATEAPRHGELLDEFSERVFANVISRLDYLEHRMPRDLRAYRCGKDKIEMIGLLVKGETTVDLSDENTPPAELFRQIQESGAALQLYRAERAYRSEDRGADLFQLMEGGALISKEGELFKLLGNVAEGAN